MRRASTRKNFGELIPFDIAGGKFEIMTRVGAGCFGEVYRAMDTTTQAEVAVKFEETDTTTPQLEHEAEVLNILSLPDLPQGFTEYFHYGEDSGFNCMVLELLGNSLDSSMKCCNGNFTPKTTVLVACQAVSRTEYLHSKGLVHRDIKPDNFAWGIGRKQAHLYMIDYGLSKRYWREGHNKLKFNTKLTGTARYASINAHQGAEQSRRDDLEAIGYMLLYFLRGSLPWAGIEGEDKQQKYRKIMEKKQAVPVDELCEGFPEAFELYLRMCRNLEFAARPDYALLRTVFKDSRRLPPPRGVAPVEHDYAFEWFDGVGLDEFVPLQDMQPQQPDDRQAARNSVRRGLFFCGGSSKVQD